MPSTQKDFKIGCWNSRGFKSAIPFLRSMLKNNDIFMINEHWLHRNCLNMLDEVSSDFCWHARASKHASEERYGRYRGQGGVAIFWDKELKGVSPIENLLHDRICGIRVEVGDGSVMVLLSVYMPASSSDDSLQVTIDELAGIVDSLEDNTTVIICGDLNGDIGSAGGPRHKRAPTKAGKVILNFMREYNLTSANLMSLSSGPVDTYYGHNGSSSIDHILIPRFMEKNVVSCRTGRNEACNTSDHIPVELVLRIDALPRAVNIKKEQKRIKWDKCDANRIRNNYQIPLEEKLSGLYNRLLESEITLPDDVDLCFNHVIESLHQAAEGVPKAKYVSHLKPYWCDELSRLKKDKMYWFKRWRDEGRTLDDNNKVRQNMKTSKKIFSS